MCDEVVATGKTVIVMVIWEQAVVVVNCYLNQLFADVYRNWDMRRYDRFCF